MHLVKSGPRAKKPRVTLAAWTALRFAADRRASGSQAGQAPSPPAGSVVAIRPLTIAEGKWKIRRSKVLCAV